MANSVRDKDPLAGIISQATHKRGDTLTSTEKAAALDRALGNLHR